VACPGVQNAASTPPPNATSAGIAMIKKLWVFIKKSLFFSSPQLRCFFLAQP
jgi:hypothetical protein